jgi:hypothetical protein
MECPTGPGTSIKIDNFNYKDLNNIPRDLKNAGYKIQVGDVWNEASIIHRSKLAGWNSYSYDSRSTWEKCLEAVPIFYRQINTGRFHENILHNKEALQVAYQTLFPN